MAGGDDLLPETIRHAYVDLGLSVRDIAARYGMARSRVSVLLKRQGVVVASRGAGRPRHSRRAPEPADLRSVLEELYVGQQLSTAQIGSMLGIPERRVRARLAQLDIPRRTPGGQTRDDRHPVDQATVRRLAAKLDVSITELAKRLDVPYESLLRTVHDLGIPVRLGGRNRRDGTDSIELVEALYADDLVTETLRSHRIPRVPAGRPLWERFPVPVPLTAALLDRLYQHCGLSTLQIEMITGQPKSTIRKALHANGIRCRSKAGRSPFWHRWRQGTTEAIQPG